MICGHTFDFARAQMSESKRAGSRLYIRTGVRYMAVRGDDDQWPVRAINNCIFINQQQRQPQISRLEFGVSQVLQRFLSLLNMILLMILIILTSHLATREALDHEKRRYWKSQVLALDEDLSNIFLGDDMNNAWITNLWRRREGSNKRGWICIEDEAISWAGLKPEKVEVRANLKLPILPDEALWVGVEMQFG